MAAVRAMTVDDLEAMMRLERGTAEAPHWERAVYEGFLAEDGPVTRRIFVAEDGNGLAGFTAVRVVAGVGELESIVVDIAARRTGIGRRLLITLIEWAREMGASRLELEVRAGNDGAIAFYERAGFRRDGLRRAYYSNPEEDAVLMGLTL